MACSYSKSNLPKQIFINNEYVNSKNSKKLTVYNPKNGDLIADDVPLVQNQSRRTGRSFRKGRSRHGW